jgi:hypothetical protein
MLKQLYKDTGNASVLPSNMQKYVTIDGDKKDLSAQEYVDAQKKAGSTKYDMLSQLIADKDFAKLSSEQKAKVVGYVYEYGNVKGKQKVSDYTTDTTWYKKMEEAEKQGVSVPDYLIAKNFYSNLEKKENRSTNLQMLDQLIADKGTNAKQDVVLLEKVANVDMEKYKSATKNHSEMLELYEVVANEDKKEDDLKALKDKGYSAAEALAKYNVADGTKKYENGEFKFGNSTKQKAKAEKLKAKGYDPKIIAKAANAVTSLGKYGTSKSWNSYIEVLEAVGITDKKFQNAFWNIYVNG